MATRTLHWLEFDYGEDEQGHGTFDAMASAEAARLPALRQELERVLDWAQREWNGVRAPLDEGGDWDFELQGVQEVPSPLAVHWDEAAGRLELRPGAPGPARVTLTGTPAFCEAFRRAFGLED